MGTSDSAGHFAFDHKSIQHSGFGTCKTVIHKHQLMSLTNIFIFRLARRLCSTFNETKSLVLRLLGSSFHLTLNTSLWFLFTQRTNHSPFTNDFRGEEQYNESV